MLRTEPVLDEAPLAVAEVVLELWRALAEQLLEDRQSELLLEQLGLLLVRFEKRIRLGERKKVSTNVM